MNYKKARPTAEDKVNNVAELPQWTQELIGPEAERTIQSYHEILRILSMVNHHDVYWKRPIEEDPQAPTPEWLKQVIPKLGGTIPERLAVFMTWGENARSQAVKDIQRDIEWKEKEIKRLEEKIIPPLISFEGTSEELQDPTFIASMLEKHKRQVAEHEADHARTRLDLEDCKAKRALLKKDLEAERANYSMEIELALGWLTSIMLDEWVVGRENNSITKGWAEAYDKTPKTTRIANGATHAFKSGTEYVQEWEAVLTEHGVSTGFINETFKANGMEDNRVYIHDRQRRNPQPEVRAALKVISRAMVAPFVDMALRGWRPRFLERPSVNFDSNF